jgi:hypothetical protein
MDRKMEKTKTYNSVIMAVVTQSIAVSILVASSLGVKRSIPLEHPGICTR